VKWKQKKLEQTNSAERSSSRVTRSYFAMRTSKADIIAAHVVLATVERKKQQKTCM